MYNKNYKKDYYDDVGILYSFTSNIGNGYCVKRWNKDFNPNTDKPSFDKDAMPDAMWCYLDNDFKLNLEYIKNKRAINTEARMKMDYPMNLKRLLNIKRELVIDHAIVAKFTLIEKDVSNKTLIFIQLEKLKRKISDGECDIEKTINILKDLV